MGARQTNKSRLYKGAIEKYGINPKSNNLYIFKNQGNPFYVGKSVKGIVNRLCKHMTGHVDATRDYINNTPVENISIQILEIPGDVKDLNDFEEEYTIRRNTHINGCNKDIGDKKSDATRAKMSASHKNMSDETRRKLSVAQKGKIKTQATRDKISATMKEKARLRKNII